MSKGRRDQTRGLTMAQWNRWHREPETTEEEIRDIAARRDEVIIQQFGNLVGYIEYGEPEKGLRYGEAVNRCYGGGVRRGRVA